MKSESTWPILEANRTWVRRLAAALVGEAADAEDLEQEAWEVALRKPPRKGTAVRAWLRQVMRRRLRNRVRGETRRRALEDAVAWSDPSSTPEEITARVELVRRTSALLAELPEAERQVLHLRYFEDRDTAEIARLLGLAEGTVRWRVKMALDQLRTRLDHETDGDRKRWRALLFPVAFPRSSREPGRAHPLGRALAGRRAVLLLAAGGIAAFLWSAHRMGPTHNAKSRADGGAPVAVARRDPAPPRFLAAAPVSDLSDCPEALALRDEVALRSRELESTEELEYQFAKGAPNPLAEDNFGKVWRPLLGTPPRCPYTFECRATSAGRGCWWPTRGVAASMAASSPRRARRSTDRSATTSTDDAAAPSATQLPCETPFPA
jgi:RNA polymerase sigma factor (sigma-70 family)